jgi:hypothetical protein
MHSWHIRHDIRVLISLSAALLHSYAWHLAIHHLMVPAASVLACLASMLTLPASVLIWPARGRLQACSTKNPAKTCQVFDGTVTDKKTSSETTSWGLLSNKHKCVFVFNAYSNETTAVTIKAYSYDSGARGSDRQHGEPE